MAKDRGKGGCFKVLIVLVLVVAGGWFLHGKWVAATSPGQAEVIAGLRKTMPPRDYDEWNIFGFVAHWADEITGRVVTLGDWEFRAGHDYLSRGHVRQGMLSDDRFVLVFRSDDSVGDTSGAGDYYFVYARPTTIFSRVRVYLHEFGTDMGEIEKRRWTDYESWVPPDR